MSWVGQEPLEGVYTWGEEMPRVRWGSLQGEGAVAGAPLTRVCYSTDQVKGTLTLQGDALSQAVSPPTVQLVTRMVMA